MPASASRRFDVFLSHSGRDKAVVERIAEKLARAGLRPWLDKWFLSAGDRWHEELASGLASSAACAVFIGPDVTGAWEREELAVALDRAAKDHEFRLFLVLLPGVPEPFDATALSPFLSTRTWVDLRGGIGDSRALQAMINATKGVPVGPEVPIEPRDEVAPYRGLEAFDEQHEEFFFGRDADVQRLVEKLKWSTFVGVVGPSGSGKSSLARAGLVPALRRGAVPGSEDWRIVTMRPGPHPLDILAGHMAALYPDLPAAALRDQLGADARTLRLLCSRPPEGGRRVMLLVDQCEEVFTLCRDEQERRVFLLGILNLAAAGGPGIVVPTLRADFYARCAAYPELAQQLSAHQFLVGAMSADGLRQAIIEPARLVGLELEAGLVDTIVEDVEHQPGALPLLQHALLELWERRRGHMVTLEAYRDSGGVAGALAKRADAILESFEPHEREVVRRILLRLTQPGEGAEDTRRRAPMSELVTAQADVGAVETVVGALAAARLLTAGGDKESDRLVEVSHEALIRGWPQLRRWVEEDRQGLRIHRRLTEAAQEWDALGRDPDALDRGARLAASREWASANEGELNELEREFLARSTAAEADQLDSARRRARRFRALAVGAVCLAAVSGVLAVYALRSTDEANEATERAERQERIATSRRLAVEASGVLAARPDTALLLGLEGFRREPTQEARSSLVTALQRDAATSMVLYATRTDGTSVAFTSDGLLLANRQGKVWRWDRSGRSLGTPLEAYKPPVNVVAVSGNGTTAAFALGTDVGVWTSADPDVSARKLEHKGWDVTGLSLSADGGRLAITDSDGSIELWDVERRRLERRLQAPRRGPNAIALSPDGRTLAVSAFSGPLRLLDVAGRRPDRVLPGLHNGEHLAFSPDSRLLTAPVGGPFPIEIWNMAGRKVAKLNSSIDNMSAASFGPGGRTLAAASQEGAIELWDLRRHRRVGEQLSGPRTLIDSLAFSRDGRVLASGGWNGTVRLWNTRPEPLARPVGRHKQPVESIAFAGPGRLFSADSGGRVRSWDVRSTARAHEAEPIALPGRGRPVLSYGAQTLVLHDPTPPHPVFDVSGQRHIADLDLSAERTEELLVALSRDGGRIATLTDSGTLQLWNALTGEPIGEPLQNRVTGEAIAFSAAGTKVALMQDGVVMLCDISTRKWSRRAFRHPADAQILSSSGNGAVAFSADDRLLASAGPDGTVRLWDVASRRLLADPLPGHPDGVTSLALSPDSRVVASAGADGTIRLFDVPNRRALGGPLRAHRRDATVAWDPTGKVLASAGYDGRVLLWDPILWSSDLRAWEHRVCGLVRRALTASEWDEFLPGEAYRTNCPA